MNSIMQDVRFSLRQLWRAPGFTATAVLTLALGIGATTAIFTLAYQVILRSIPVSHPEQLYKLGKDFTCCMSGGLQTEWNLFSFELYKSLRDQAPAGTKFLAVQAGVTTVSARRPGNNGAGEPIDARFVSGSYFPVLGVQAFEGRLLGPDDDREGAPPAAVISNALWHTKFGTTPGMVGSTLMLSGHPVTLVGITAANFLGERNEQDQRGLWLPLSQELVFEPQHAYVKHPEDAWLDVMLRIQDKSQVERIQQAIQGGMRQWINAHPEAFVESQKSDFNKQTVTVSPASGGINALRDQYEKSLKLLLLVAGFVLLIACANLANLMLVRGMARQQELSVRSALGAPRARLVRQMLVEAVVLSLGGGVASLVVAFLGARAILSLTAKGAEISPLAASPSLPVLGFAFVVSLVTGLLFGALPAWITSRSSPIEALRGSNRSTKDATALPQRLLVIFQAALSLVLLSSAGLLISSLRNVEHQNFHFDPHGRVLAFIDLPAAGYTYEKLPALYQQMDDTFARMPGVESFGYALTSPMTQSNYADLIYQPGKVTRPNRSSMSFFSTVNAGYFRSIGSHVLVGRGITDGDTATSREVAVVNKAFADRFLKDKQPIGEHFGTNAQRSGEYEVVGVVEDTKYDDLTHPVIPMFFTAIKQGTPAQLDGITPGAAEHFASNLVVQYRGDTASGETMVRQALRSINPDIAITRLTSYEDALSVNFTTDELVVRLTTLFGLVALILAAVGLYGVTAYAVARRTSEIGIRMALGANRGSVLRMIMQSALTQSGIGLLLGLPLTYAAGRLLQSTLYQTSAFQPLVLVVVCGLLITATLAAAAIPSRRAASIDPMRALRTE